MSATCSNWQKRSHVTEKERLCTPDVELFAESFRPCCLLRGFTCVTCQRCMWSYLLSCYQARKTASLPSDGDLWRFLPHLSTVLTFWKFYFLVYDSLSLINKTANKLTLTELNYLICYHFFVKVWWVVEDGTQMQNSRLEENLTGNFKETKSIINLENHQLN